MSDEITPAAPGRAPLFPETQRRIEQRPCLHGPVPLDWLSSAARLPGRSLHAGIALWHATAVARSATVPLSNLAGIRFGLDRNAKYRALAWLEEAGLVSVERKLGRAPMVTIVDPVDSKSVDPSASG